MPSETSWIIPLSTSDSPESIIAKAAQVVPHPRQQTWQELELTAFIHFGVNTFTGREWGTGLEDPAIFNPSDLDARQWISVLKEAGFKQVVLTAKHHDGFCLWPSRYTDFSVKHSPWRAGHGDVVRELADAARQAGLKVGMYLSPADLHEMEAPGGRYGNGSPVVESTIPSLLPGDERRPPHTFTYAVDDYNRYYLNQLYELLTEYGPLHEVWFDGANPKPGVAESYNYADWFALVRALAPEAVMFNGPDLRWVGNESGLARESEWSVLPFAGDPAPGLRPLDALADDQGSRAKLLSPAEKQGEIDATAGPCYLAWYPAEVDVSIRPGWFYHTEEDEYVKTLEQLMHIYDYSVGRNGVLLLNIPPDRRGRFAEPDCARLREFGAELRRIYQHDLTEGALLSGTNTFAPDGQPAHCWSPAADTGELVIELPQAAAFNRILLQEHITSGQRVEAFSVDAWLESAWKPFVNGGTIGYKRILSTDSPVEAQRIRLRILSARAAPRILRIGLFLQ